MKLIKAADYEEMSRIAAGIIAGMVQENPALNLGLATGATPEGMYRELIKDHKLNGTSYEQAGTFNLDEYAGLDADHPNSYHYYMDQLLFEHINIDKEKTHLPDGTAPDLEEECRSYDKRMEEAGGIDIQVLGIGQNGHIGFNEPGTSFTTGTHIVELAPSTREANARYFSSPEQVPERAVTMGIASIMRSKEILLLISGSKKANAVKQLLEGEITEQFPASILKTHPHVTIIADVDALSLAELDL